MKSTANAVQVVLACTEFCRPLTPIAPCRRKSKPTATVLLATPALLAALAQNWSQYVVDHKRQVVGEHVEVTALLARGSVDCDPCGEVASWGRVDDGAVPRQRLGRSL